MVKTVSVKATEKFVASKDAHARANVGYTGSNFNKFFLDLVEENVGDASIDIHVLGRDSLGAQVMAELGSRAKIKLAHLFELLEQQAKGEAGPLLVNGSANVAYIVGKDGNVWAVDACWRGADCWHVNADSVGAQGSQYAGHQVLSCDS